jgi:mucin-19
VIRTSLPTYSRVLSRIQFTSILALFLILSGWGGHLSAAQLPAPVQGPKIWLRDNQSMPVKPVGAPTLVQSVAAGQAQPLSMATADVDGDGVADMVAGFSAPGGGAIVIHRGNLDAFAPQSNASFQAIGRGQFPVPFLTTVQIINIPVRPDFIALGRFTSGGHQDLVVAALGGSSLYILPGDGKGKFGIPQTVALSGGVTAMAAENLLQSLPYSNLVVGVATSQNSSLLVFSGTDSGLSPPAVFSLAAPAGNIIFGGFGDSHIDTAFLSGGNVFILHSSNFQMEALSLPVNASAMALGSFIFDRTGGLQIALLTSDGSLHIAAHTEFDPRTLTNEDHQARLHVGRRGFGNPLDPPRTLPQNGFKIVESIASAAPFSAGQPPVLFRTRISDHGGDDVMVLNPSMGQLSVISHPDVPPGATTFLPAQISTRPYSGSPVAALPMRTNIDGRSGVVALHQGQLAPAVMMPLPDPTFFVNRTDDVVTGTTANTCNNISNADVSSSCSLREAVLKANATAGTDTIILAAGTYTLTIARQAGDNTGAHGGLYINDSVNIVGAGQASTIIQGGTSAATGVDLVFAVNEDIQTITSASASFSNLTIKFGHNRGSVAGFDGDGGCMEYDTGSSGTATLTLTNVTISNCVTQDGNGGGLASFNSIIPGAGQPTISNSIFQNNSVAEQGAGSAGSGGGIWIADQSRMSMTNTQVINNTATQVNGSGRGVGGGIFIFSAGSGSLQTQIHVSTITGNSASGFGGGIWSASNLLVDNTGGATLISGNAAGANAGGAQNGGGVYLNPASPDSTTLTKVTITSNTATGNGGGIATGNNTGAGALTMHFSRLAGNTASVGNNLDNDDTTVTATNNWWGTNTPANTISNRNTGATTSSPFVELTNTASPVTIKINQSSTLTDDLSKDNNGSGGALAGNLDVLVGLPITFNNAILGTIPQAQPETLNASAQATATFNAGGTSGAGHADATIDQQTVTANIIILEPLQITKNFNPTTVLVNASSTLTFAVNNPNVIAVDASFTDTLPAGLVVAATPGVTNTCGGTVTATAGSGSISFSNASQPVGACTITVKVSAPTDGVFNNTVTINSTAAGTGAQSTSSATLTVINPPSITKAFGAATIPLNGTTSLTFTITSPNANLALNGIAFSDSLPAGLVVATPSGISSTCSGTSTAVAGSSSVSLSAATLAAGTSCTVSVNVQGTTAGIKNNSVTVSSTNGGTGNTSNASITVVGPPVIIKAFGAASIPLNGSTSLSFTIQNNNTTTLTGVGFGDTLPAGLVVSTPNGLTGTCGGGTITAVAGSGTISLSGATIAGSSSCTFSVNVTGTIAGTKNNTTGNVTSTEGGTGGTASASINVVVPPSIAKVFNPTAIALNATTSLTFTITNPAANAVALTGVAFTDTLPTGLTVANASVTVCGGTLTTTAATGIALNGAIVAASSQCQFSVTVTGAVSGQYTNTTGNVTSTNGGTGNTATANLTVATPPSISKAFGAATIPLNGTTSLTFSITNPNTSLALTGLAFTDNLPSGLVVATPSGISNTCGGTATAVAGLGSVSLSAGTLAGSASCMVSVNVQGTTAGIKNNSVTITSTEGGTGNTSNASITVVGAPVIIKAFGAAGIPLNGSTSLSFTIQNNNTTTTLTGVGFSDTLPAGLAISTPNGQTGTCGGGTITATAGTNVIGLSGGSLAANASCTFSVNVTGISAGLQNNTTGNVTSTEGGTGGTASASINVAAPPSIAKVFSPATIALNATTSLTFTITNPAANTVALTGVTFSDTLPTGLTVANASATVCGGTLTTSAPTGITLTGATIAVNSQCQFSVTVTGAASGQFTNTTGNVTSTNGGTGNTAAANLTVAAAPSITKAFGAASIPLNGTTSLTFTIQNPNTNLALAGIAFTDSLPTGLVVASTPNLTNTCGGTATAAGGSSSVSLFAGTVSASASCTVSVNVTGATGGVKNNSVQVTSTEGGTGNTSNASITVVGAPVIIKAFGAAGIPLNGSTSLSFTIQNNNTTTTLTGVGFSDTLPAGLVISTPNGQTGTCGGGTITATAGTNVISLSGGSPAASSSCTFSVNVTGISAGLQNNTTGTVTSTEGGTGGTASASINVVAPPSIAKIFNPATISLNATTSLTFTITNPAANATALTGVAFIDTLPVGITVANASATVCGGTLTTTAPTGIALTGATIATNSQCQFSVTVTGAASGAYTNTTGNVTSTNGGTGNTASANLTVATPPAITKAFGAAQMPLNGTTSLSFNISNPNTNLTLNGVAFTDSLPVGLVIASTPNLNSTCGGTATAVAGSSSVSLSAATLAASASCTVSVNVQGVTGGVKNNSVQVTSTEGGTGNTSNASITVVGAPVLIKAFGAASIPLNGSTLLSFTIQNNNTTTSLTGVGFTDTLPAGLVISTPNGQTGTCGIGIVTAIAGTNSMSLTGGTLAASSSCSFAVNVTGISAGLQNNTTGNVTSTEGGTGGTASTSIKVEAPPSIAKVFNPNSIALNATASLTFTITNPAANVDPLAGIAFTDTLPAGLTVVNASATVCGGTLTTAAPTGIALSGATIAVNSQCQFSVTVTGAASGQLTNTTGNVTSTNGGTGNTATANLTVATPPTITKAFGAAQIPLNGTTSLTFNITNPSANVISLTGISFTDSLPAGLVVATPASLSNTCGGTATAVAGSSSVSLSAATLAPGASCTIAASVQGVTPGVKTNNVTVASTEAGTGNTSNASITVVGAPAIIKAFGAVSIPLTGSTSLSFTIQNSNATTAMTGIGFTDTLPAGLLVSTPNGQTGSCGSGSITATQGTSTIGLSGATLAASASCTFSINVTGTSAGTKNNTTGNIVSTEGGTGGTASASINVVAPPSIAKVFNPANIALNATASLTFTVTNPAANVVALAGVAFTDTLPTGLTVANASATVCGGTLTTTTPTGIILTGATIATGSQCQFSVTVTGAASGQFTNTTGNVTSTNGGAGNTASANLSVATPPSIAKVFGAAAIPLNGTTSLTFNIINPNITTSLTGIAFTDALPAGLVIAPTPALANTCGGTATAGSGSGSISLTGSTLAANSSCTVSVNVQGTTSGVKNNSVTVSATESGVGTTGNASLTVTAPPTLIKVFGAASIPLNGSTTLSFTVTNPNATVALTGIQFGDTLPAGLNVGIPNGLTGSCGVGTISTGSVSGFSTVSLAGGSLPTGGSCTFSINVVGIAPGLQNNSTGLITSAEGGTGGTASAPINVVAPPAIAKAFNPTTIAVNGVSTLTFTIINPAANAVAEAGVAFSDSLPAGMVVATPNNLTGTCGGTQTATAGAGTVGLSGGSIATGSSCTLSVDVTGSAAGVYHNTSGTVSSTNGGTGNTASAILTIAVADLTIVKTHTGIFARGQNGANWIITVKNSGAGPTLGAVNVVDTLPNVTHPPVPTAMSGTGWTCTLATLACTRSDALAPAASYPPITVMVNIPTNIQNNFTNTATVSGGGETNTGNDTATDPISLGPPIIITPRSATATVVAGSSATYIFDVQDQDLTQGVITFGCGSLPVGTACSFSPATANQALTTVTMTVTTSNGKAVVTARNSGMSGRSPLYAALFFPVFGMVGIALSGRRGRKARMRFALVVIGALALLSFAGCASGMHGIATPPGNYQLSVSAASATIQVSAPVTLTVQ